MEKCIVVLGLLVASYDKLRNLVNQSKDLNIMGLAPVILFFP
jgi:hypothetical protein